MDNKGINKMLELLKYLYENRFNGTYQAVPSELQDYDLIRHLLDVGFIETQEYKDELKDFSHTKIRITPKGVDEYRVSRFDSEKEKNEEKDRKAENESIWKKNKYLVPSIIITGGLILSPILTEITTDAIHHSSDHNHPEKIEITVENLNTSKIDTNILNKSVTMSAADFIKLYNHFNRSK